MSTSGAGGVALAVADRRHSADLVPLKLLMRLPLYVVRRIDPVKSGSRQLGETRPSRHLTQLRVWSAGQDQQRRLYAANVLSGELAAGSGKQYSFFV